MGFFDSIRGIGRALGGFIESAIPILGPPLLNIGAQVLQQKLLGQPSGQIQRQRLSLPAFPPPIVQPRVRGLPTRPSDPFRGIPIPGRAGVPGGIPQAQAGFPSGGRVIQASFPGGFSMPAFPGDRFDVGGGFRQAGFDIPGVDIVSPFQSQFAGQCPTLFRQGTSVRPIPLIMVSNPETGAPVFYKHAGRPILFSGDLSAAKKVARIAQRARRRSPR